MGSKEAGYLEVKCSPFVLMQVVSYQGNTQVLKLMVVESLSKGDVSHISCYSRCSSTNLSFLLPLKCLVERLFGACCRLFCCCCCCL